MLANNKMTAALYSERCVLLNPEARWNIFKEVLTDSSQLILLQWLTQR